MKTLLAAMILSTSSIVLAMPSVNDSAQFDVQVQSGGKTTDADMEVTLTDFNSTSNQYKQVTKWTSQGQSQTQEEWVDAKNLATDAQVHQLLADCAGAGGTAEMVTVPAGTFETCRMRVEKDNAVTVVWMGGVSFGVVKLTRTKGDTGETMTIVLKDHKRG